MSPPGFIAPSIFTHYNLLRVDLALGPWITAPVLIEEDDLENALVQRGRLATVLRGPLAAS